MKKKILLFLLVLFIIDIILVAMDFTWGETPKSQTDNQKISEAIAEAISAHEADPEAHLGEGESLQQHKSNEVIDHPALSVVADKFSGSQTLVSVPLNDLDNYNQNGVTVTNPGITLTTTSVNNSDSAIAPADPGPSHNLYWTSDFLIQFMARFFNCTYGQTNFEFSLGVGDAILAGANSGFGFRYISGVLKAYVYKSGTFTYSSLSSLDLSFYHVYRAWYNNIDQMVYFYIDGVLVASIAKPSSPPPADDYFELYLKQKQSGGSQRQMQLRSIFVSEL